MNTSLEAQRFRNYQKKHKEEVGEYARLTPKETGLPVDICVDCYKSYQLHNHSLWLLFVNGYSSKDGYVPLTVETSPQLPFNVDIRLYSNDFVKIKRFASIFASALQDCADNNIWINELLEIVKHGMRMDESAILDEMSVIHPCQSGAKRSIYIDDTGAWQHAQHNLPRVKIECPKGEKNPRKWVPVILPDCTIPDNAVVDSTKDIKSVLAFIRANKDDIIRVLQHTISVNEFLALMRPIDGHGNVIGRTNINGYETIRKAPNDHIVVKNQDKKLNIVNLDGKPLFDIWFDDISEFGKPINGIQNAAAWKGGDTYILYSNGKYVKVG